MNPPWCLTPLIVGLAETSSPAETGNIFLVTGPTAKHFYGIFRYIYTMYLQFYTKPSCKLSGSSMYIFQKTVVAWDITLACLRSLVQDLWNLQQIFVYMKNIMQVIRNFGVYEAQELAWGLCFMICRIHRRLVLLQVIRKFNIWC